MKNIIEGNCNNGGDIHWLPVDVDNGETVTVLYPPRSELYSRRYRPGEIGHGRGCDFLAHFRRELIEDKDVFASEDDTTTIYFSQRLKDTLKKRNLQGLGFESWEIS